MTSHIDTGYEGQKPEPELEVEFDLEGDALEFSSHTTARIVRNGIPCGLVYLKSQEEFQWLRNRIKGIFDPDRGGDSEKMSETSQDFQERSP